MSYRGLISTGAVLTCVLAGCGGGGTSTRTTASLPKAQWLKKASAICVEGTKEMGKLDAEAWKKYDPSHQNPTPALADKVAFALLPARETELRRIRALGLPQGDEAFVEKMLKAWGEGIRRGKEDHRSLRVGGAGFAFYRTYSMGIDYGLEKCWLG
jgi:hypothetical protein